MALRKQKVGVLFTKGTETKADEVALPIDGLVELENGEFNKMGRIDKRAGFTKTTETSWDISSARDNIISRRASIKSNTLYDGREYRDKSQDFKAGKGISSGISYSSMAVSSGSTYSQEDPHVSISDDGKYALVTFTAIDSGVSYSTTGSGHSSAGFKGKKSRRCSLIDRENGILLASDILIGNSDPASSSLGGMRMRSAWANNKFYIVGEDYPGLIGSTVYWGGLYLWMINPTDANILLRKGDGSLSTDGSGTEIVSGVDYPLDDITDSGGSLLWPYTSYGASFDVCQSSDHLAFNMVYTKTSGSSTTIEYHRHHTTTPSLSAHLWTKTISSHFSTTPTYYTLEKSRSDDKLWLSLVDGSSFKVLSWDEDSTTAPTEELVESPGSHEFFVRASFFENTVYYSYSEDNATAGTGELGLWRKDLPSTGRDGKIANSGLTFVLPSKNSGTEQSGPITVGTVPYAPIPSQFSTSGESLSDLPLETIRLSTENQTDPIFLAGRDEDNMGHLIERDYLHYGAIERSHIKDALAVATPGFITGSSASSSVLEGTVLAAPVGTNYNTFDGEQVLNSSIHLYDFRSEASDKPQSSTATLQDTSYVADNGLFMYDGDKYHPVGLLQQPWIGFAFASTPSQTGDMEASDEYYYKGLFEWEDALGNLHQGPPSGFVKKSGTAKKATIYHPSNDYISSYPLDTSYTPPPGVYRDVKFAIFRTEDGGTSYNLNTTLNSFHSNYITKGFTDMKNDESNSLGRFLYSDSGEISNTPPPSPAVYVCSHGNRLVIIGKDRRVYYSKLAVPGFGIGFNPALEIKLPDRTGDKPVALGSMDGNLIIFTEKSIYIVSGEGPDNLGSGKFSEPRKVPSSTGAGDLTPVVLISEGLIYTRDENIYILRRNHTSAEIGTPAYEMLRGKKIRAIEVSEERKTIYFLTNSSTSAELITYNVLFGQWGKHVINGETSIDSIASLDGNIVASCYLNLYTVSDGYKDGTLYNSLKLKTSWIKLDTYKGVHKFSSLQGYQRAYNFQILGECKDPMTLTVKVYYDYDGDTAVDTLTKEISSAGRIQLKGHLSKQKCSAVQFEIYDTASSSTVTGEGFTINHIELEIGQKMDQYRDGLRKIPSSGTMTGS